MLFFAILDALYSTLFFFNLYCFCFMFWFLDHKSCRILVPRARIRLHALQGKVLTTKLPGKSPSSSLCSWITLSSHIHRLLSLTFLKSLFKCLIFSASPWMTNLPYQLWNFLSPSLLLYSLQPSYYLLIHYKTYIFCNYWPSPLECKPHKGWISFSVLFTLFLQRLC